MVVAVAAVLSNPRPAHAEGAGESVAPVIPPDVAARVGISDAQQVEISRIAIESNRELVELRKKHRSAQQALEKLLQVSTPPREVVLTQVERVGAAETEVRKNRVALMLELRRVLGPELWAKLQLELELEKRIAERQRGATPRGSEIPRVGEPIRPVSGTLR